MRPLFAKLAACAGIILLSGCTSFFNKRDIASQESDSNYRSLKMLASSGIALSTSISIFSETQIKEVGDCRRVEPIDWDFQVQRIARILEQNPQLASKFHFLRIERGGLEPSVSVVGPADSRVLLLKYSKRRSIRVIDIGDEVPCPDQLSQLIGQNLVSVQFDWPTDNKIFEVLNSAMARSEVDSHGQDSLLWLAERGYVVNLLGPQGEALDKAPESRWAEIFPATVKSLSSLEGVLARIKQHSEQSKNVGVFVVKALSQDKAGIEVTATSEYSADINQKFELTAPFIASGFGGLSELEQCLQKKQKENPMWRGFSVKRNSYLYPGLRCQ